MTPRPGHKFVVIEVPVQLYQNFRTKVRSDGRFIFHVVAQLFQGYLDADNQPQITVQNRVSPACPKKRG